MQAAALGLPFAPAAREVRLVGRRRTPRQVLAARSRVLDQRKLFALLAAAAFGRSLLHPARALRIVHGPPHLPCGARRRLARSSSASPNVSSDRNPAEPPPPPPAPPPPLPLPLPGRSLAAMVTIAEPRGPTIAPPVGLDSSRVKLSLLSSCVSFTGWTSTDFVSASPSAQQ